MAPSPRPPSPASLSATCTCMHTCPGGRCQGVQVSEGTPGSRSNQQSVGPMPGEGEDSYTPSPPRCNLQKTPARRSPKGALREGGTGGPSPAPTCRCAVRGTLALALRASAVPVGVAPRPGRRRAGASPRGERPAGRRTVPAQHLRSGHSVPVPVGQVCPIGRSRGPNGVRPKGLQLEGHAPFWLRFILRLSGSGPG